MISVSRRTFLASACGLAISGLPSLTRASFPTSVTNDIWEISTRHLPCGTCGLENKSPDFQIFHSTSNDSCWRNETMEQLVERVGNDNQPDRITVIYVHGNWMTRENARSRSKFIAKQISDRGMENFRLLSLSWPSQREPRPVRDIVENSDCADSQAFYLADILRQLPIQDRISLLGFSFGGRVVAGALHLEAGGTLNNSQAAAPEVPRIYRVSLVAPAFDRTWMKPEGRFGKSMLVTDKLVNLYNLKDPVLKKYRFIDRIARPIAAGFAGLVGIQVNMGLPQSNQPLASHERLVQYDCGGTVGATHDERSYFLKCGCSTKALQNLMWQDYVSGTPQAVR